MTGRINRGQPQVVKPQQPAGQQPVAQQPANTTAAGTTTAVISHEANEFRPLTAPEIKPGERVLKQFPNATYGVQKLQAIAAAATGQAGDILKKAAGAADRILTNATLSGGRPGDRLNEPAEGRIIRQVRVMNGQHEVRVVFQPAQGRPVPVDPSKVEGIPNGANATLRPDGAIDLSRARPLTNMVGTVQKSGDGFVVVSSSAMSPLKSLKLEGGSDALVGKTVLVDVQSPSSPQRKGIIHDVLTPRNELQRLEMVTAADAGLALTFSPEVLAQVQKLKDNPPAFDLKPGMRDLRALNVIATDNPGSRSDHRSVDPEQASNVSFEKGRMVVTDFLANRKLIVPRDSPVDANGMKVMQTFYGSGFDAPALPAELSEDLAVFLQDKPRYATAVKAVYDVVPSKADGAAVQGLGAVEQQVLAASDGQRTLAQLQQQLGGDPAAIEVALQSLSDKGALKVEAKLVIDESEVFDALVTNRWAGSYRDADRVYASEKGDTRFADTMAGLPPGVKDQLDAFRFAGKALRTTSQERGQLNAGGNDERYESEQVREQFSTSINEVIAMIAKKAGVDLIQRYHPEAKEMKQDRFREFAEAFGVPWPANESFAEYVDAIPDRVAKAFADRTPQEQKVIEEIVRGQAYRSLEKAVYSVEGGGHAGLAKQLYAHASASNRQNTGKANLDQAQYASDVLKGTATKGNAPYSSEQLVELAEHATDVELLYARVIERQIENVRNAIELKPREGTTVKAMISGANPGGLELRVLDPAAKVFVPMAALGGAFKDRFELSESSTGVMSNGGVRFSVGQTVDLQIRSVETELGSVDAVPLADPNAKLEPQQQRQDDGDRNRNRNDRGRNRGRNRGNRF